MKRLTQTTLWFVTAVLLDLANQAQETEQPAPEKSQMLVARILVLDPDGHPLEGATVTQSGLRTKVEPGSHWLWNRNYHGPEPEVVTNAEGIADVPYPKYVAEKLETGKMTWSVSHPEFVSFRQDRSVDDNPAEIKLARGFRIAVNAIHAETSEPIKTELFATISNGGFAEWKLHENGMLVSPVFEEADSVMRVMQMVHGRPVLFSDRIEISPAGRSRVLIKDVKLSIGTRVEGRLADSVLRPVNNGYVTVNIVRIPVSKARFNSWWWSDRAPIAEDGTFVFESLPSNEVLQMIPICDDWVPAKPSKESVLKFYPDQLANLDSGFCLPQLIELTDETARPILEMEPATSVRVTVLAPDGNPLPNAEVFMCPNQMWFNFGTQMLGEGTSMRQYLLAAKRNELGAIQRTDRFSKKTDALGIAIIEHLPANRSEYIAAGHDNFELPVSGRDRTTTVELKKGEVAEITIKMQNRGTEVLGAEKEDKAEDDSKQNEGGGIEN